MLNEVKLNIKRTTSDVLRFLGCSGFAYFGFASSGFASSGFYLQ